jgi:hypothetical protein
MHAHTNDGDGGSYVVTCGAETVIASSPLDLELDGQSALGKFELEKSPLRPRTRFLSSRPRRSSWNENHEGDDASRPNNVCKDTSK